MLILLLITLVFIINFRIAINTCDEDNLFFKIIYIIPPFAIIKTIGILVVIISVILFESIFSEDLGKEINKYFKK